MLAENVYTIALHLSVEEQERLYAMLGEKVSTIQFPKHKKKKIITDKEAIEYLVKNVFSKVK